jgi:glycosyltransferase involved in cell wall biosynthesis
VKIERLKRVWPGTCAGMRIPKRTINHQLPWVAGVVVPAHNEEGLIERCLHSLLDLQLAGELWIVVVADVCTDTTVVKAKSMLGIRGEVIETMQRNAGASRSLGADRVMEYFASRHPGHPVWLANTDADSCVPAHWIQQQLTLATKGAHAIAGVVDIDTFTDFDAGMKDRFDHSYGIGKHGTHPHVQAANFGLSAAAYKMVGGWPPMALGEDRELWNRLGEHGLERVADRSVRVTTSGRSQGRIPGGFADCLKLLASSSLSVVS